jgi:hypothetical protein
MHQLARFDCEFLAVRLINQAMVTKQIREREGIRGKSMKQMHCLSKCPFHMSFKLSVSTLRYLAKLDSSRTMSDDNRTIQ